MIINRHNYEEFFLLYIDGELSATEQQAVDAFVDQHPDLKEELEMLQQTKLLPGDAMAFTDKDSLFKHTDEEAINGFNYEEKFLLYVDNELGNTDKAAVETFVLQHPQFQDAFTRLKQTRLEPEVVPHPDKTALYRKEEKERPVIYLRWWRIAAAAIVIGLGIGLWIILPPSKNVTTPAENVANAGTSPARHGNIPEASPAPHSNQVTINPSTETGTVASAGVVKKENSHLLPLKGNQDVSHSTIDDSSTKEASSRRDNDVAEATNKVIGHNKNNLPIPEPRKNNTTTAMVVNDPADEPLHNSDIINPRSNNIISAAVNNSNNNNVAKPQATVYKELDTNDDDKSLYVGSLEINKDKLRGLTRKVGRLLGNKSKTANEDKTIMVSNR